MTASLATAVKSSPSPVAIMAGWLRAANLRWNNARLRTRQLIILAGLVTFALALCALVVVMMLLRGPAVAY